MAEAFQCDRCNDFQRGKPKKEILEYTNQNIGKNIAIELCDECCTRYDKFMKKEDAFNNND